MMMGAPTKRKLRNLPEHCSFINLTLKKKKEDGGSAFPAAIKTIQYKAVEIVVFLPDSFGQKRS